MTPRRIALFALIAAVLAGAAALLFWLQSPAEPSRPLAKLKASDLARIELDYNGSHIALEKTAGRWRLTAPVADEAEDEAASGLARGLHDLARGSEVSREPSSYADYELNESSAVRVRVYSRTSAAPVLDGYFGNPAMANAVYFRPSGEAAVYLVEGVEPSALRRNADELRGKALVSISVGDLAALKFGGAGGFSLIRSSDTWAASGRKLTANQAAEIVLSVTSLRFIGFLPGDTPANKTGFAAPALDLTATGAGRSERVLIGRENAGRRYAKAEARAAQGTVSKPDVDALLKLLRR